MKRRGLEQRQAAASVLLLHGPKHSHKRGPGKKEGQNNEMRESPASLRSLREPSAPCFQKCKRRLKATSAACFDQSSLNTDSVLWALVIRRLPIVPQSSR